MNRHDDGDRIFGSRNELRGLSGDSPVSPGPRRAPRNPAWAAIRISETYSLRDAALILKIPEGQLRRSVLFGELPADEVDDDRQYVFSGKTLLAYARGRWPDETIEAAENSDTFWGLVLLLLFPLLAAVLLVIAGASASGSCQQPPLPSPGSGVELQVPGLR